MSDNVIKDKVAIVTGATRGIGKAIAHHLLQQGVKVMICGRKQESVDATVAELKEYGELYGVAADISKLEDVKRLIAETLHKLGNIHVLVNNAGVGIFGSVAALQPEDFERMIALNLTGAYYCCHEVLPIFQAQGNGDIINISSLAGKNPFAGGAGYNATKFGLNGFSDAMMLDHRNDGVRVSTVMPGSVNTEFGGEEKGGEWKIAPEDIAAVVIHLLRMPRRTTVSSVEIRPSRPARRV